MVKTGVKVEVKSEVICQKAAGRVGLCVGEMLSTTEDEEAAEKQLVGFPVGFTGVCAAGHTDSAALTRLCLRIHQPGPQAERAVPHVCVGFSSTEAAGTFVSLQTPASVHPSLRPQRRT